MLSASLLWKISLSGGPSSYLFGTMHIKDKRVFKWIPELEEYIAKCEVYAAEFPLEDMQNDTFTKHFLLENSDLHELVGRKKFEKYKTISKKAFGIDLTHLSKVKPLFIVNLITESVLGKESSIPLDTVLWNMAKDNNLQLTGVETYESQLEVLKYLDIKQQLRSLDSCLSRVTQFRRKLSRLMEVYLSQDIRKIHQLSRRNLGKSRKLLLNNRNLNMAQKIEELCGQNTTFVSIGAAHLAGHFGVLALLKRRGFSVESVII